MAQDSRFEFSRADRVRKALMREVSDILRREVKDPRIADTLVSIIDVEVSGDLRHAKVFVSVMADEDKQTEIMAILDEWTPRIRSEVGQRIRLRYTPEIVFLADNALERGARVSQLLEQIRNGDV